MTDTPLLDSALITDLVEVDLDAPTPQAVGFRSTRRAPGFHEVRRDRQTVGVILRRSGGFDVFARGSIDVVARKHTISAAKAFAALYFAGGTDAH